MVGISTDRDRQDHPLDPSDFNRCLNFLECVPDARAHMGRAAAISPLWKKLVDNWAAIEQCFLDEVGLNWSKGRHLKAPKTAGLLVAIRMKA